MDRYEIIKLLNFLEMFLGLIRQDAIRRIWRKPALYRLQR